MQPSLSVLLPVRNCQATLADLLRQILELVPELTDRFEVVVVDDGSTDATIEVADEFAAYYPQVRAIRHARPLGRVASVRSGLTHSSGQFVLVRDEHCQTPVEEIARLWRAMVEGSAGGWPAAAGPSESGPELVVRGGFRIFNRGLVQSPHTAITGGAASPEDDGPPERPKRPNFLQRLRQLAWDE